ncbi:MAG: hypothetical protein KJ814_09315, partial [Proteobacteria bacterium]|nr:hypothetical protein [Pseudomonadota bacterium]
MTRKSSPGKRPPRKGGIRPKRGAPRRSIEGKRSRPHARMRPEAEPALKPVFAKIGKPVAAKFRPDPFQLASLEAIRDTDCLVMAPTGSGKTWIAEEAIRSVFQKGGR